MKLDFKQYQTFFANFPQILILHDDNANILYTNQKTEQYFLSSQEKLEGKNIYELIPSIINFKKEIKNKRIYFQFPSQSKHSYFNVNRWLVQKTEKTDIWAISFNENKRIEYHLQIMNKLKESEGKFKQLYNSSPIGIAYLDLEGNILDLNQKFSKILGFPSTIEAKQINILDHHPLTETEIPNMFLETIKNKETRKKRIKYINQLGKIVFINIYTSPIKINNEVIAGVLINLEDVSAKVKMEKALENQMTFLDNIIEHLPMGVEVFDKNGLLKKVNSSLEKIMDLEKKNPLIDKFNITKDEFATTYQSNQYFLKARDTQKIQKREISIDFDINENKWTKNKNQKVFYETYVPILNSNKETEAIVLIMEDITARKNYENALKQNEQIFRGMFNHHSAVMLLIDSETRQILNVNQAAEIFYGYSLSKLQTMKISDLNILSELEVQERLTEANNRKQNYFQFKHILADNSVRDVEVHSTPILQNNRKILFSIIHDITERKEIESKLKRNEQKYRKLFEESGDVAFLLDIKGNIIEVNQRASEMFEYSKKELLGLKVYQLYPKHTLEKVKKDMEILIKNKRINTEQIMQKSNGEKIYVDISLTLLNEEKGIVQGVLRNITERKKSEIKLQILVKQLEISKKELTTKTEELEDNKDYLEDYNKRLENALLEQHELRINLEKALEELTETQSQLIQSEKMASLGVLTSGVAHEINNPINFIKGGIDILEESIAIILEILKSYDQLEKCHTSERIEIEIEKIFALKQTLEFDELVKLLPESMENIKVGVSRTVDIIRNLKSFSRLDEADVKAVNIHEGLDSTLLLLNNILKYKADIIKEYDSDLPLVECWANQINQVFMNIIHNAAQAIEKYGIIKIKTSIIEENFVEISIEDNGKGMTTEIQKKVFEPFYTTKPVGEGNGLGMYISYRIMQKHKGSIKIESKFGEGTKFILNLPIDYTPSTHKIQN